MLQSLFTWIFYLFQQQLDIMVFDTGLQSLFTWIFYLFKKQRKEWTQVNLLQSLFTWIFYLFLKEIKAIVSQDESFNPYSPGFSIYLKLPLPC